MLIRLAQAMACRCSCLVEELLLELLLVCSVVVSLLVVVTTCVRVWFWLFNTVVDVLEVDEELPPLEEVVDVMEVLLVRPFAVFKRVLGITGGLRGYSLQVTSSTTNQNMKINKIRNEIKIT